MSNPTLYHFNLSGPSRGALLAARAVGFPIDIKTVNLFEKEQFNPDFIRLNPQHCVPTLDDNGFVLWESRAIAIYLAEKYGKDDLYPKDIKKRALVNQRLYFDSSFLYPKIRAICFPILYQGVKSIPEEKKTDLDSTLHFLDLFLKDSKWLVGDNYTIADTSLAASISSLMATGYDLSTYENIERWIKLCEDTLPGFHENKEGAKQFGEAVKAKLEAP